jgi:Xaa-Pro aminopeptidase
MDKKQEFAVKLERTRAFMQENGLDALMLARGDNFAWLGCGADNLVNHAAEVGVAGWLVTQDDITLVTNNIEAERMVTEEVRGLDLDTPAAFPWHEPACRLEILDDLTDGMDACAADDGTPGWDALPAGFQNLRFELIDPELSRYRALGIEISGAVEDAARSVEQGMTERDVAACMQRNMQKQGIVPIVLLVAADERIKQWRHPIVKDAEVERACMLVTCGRRQGLICAITRLVHFGQLSDDLRQRHDAVCNVDARIMAATRPGTRIPDVFAEMQQAYADNGFDGEWQYHHQGGATGYLGRDYIANPNCEQTVQENQAFAWNPSICGTKTEDTMLARMNAVELLTSPGQDWPVLEVEASGQVLRRPDILVK